MSAPVAYIRRSVARTGDPGDVSREFQTDKVRSLANGDGPTLRIVDGDWGRSAGRHKAEHRAAFRQLVADIEAGKVSTLYAYSTDRLARDAESAYGLLNAAERAGTTIVTSEGRFPPGDRMARQMFGFQAMQNEAALDAMTDKSSAVAGKRKERGDHMGRAPYGYRHQMIDGVSTLVPREGEDPEHVVQVFRSAGSYLAAARALNEEAFPTRFDRTWDPTAVRHVVLRWDREHGTGYAPVRTRRGAPARSKRLFAGLLQCPHRQLHPATPTLTSGPVAGGVRYYCRAGHHDPTHPRPYIVSERKVLEWAKRVIADELGPRLVAEADPAGEPSVTVRHAALEARRDRVRDALLDGLISKERARRELASIDAEAPALEAGRRAVSWFDGGKWEAAIDWDGDPAEVNARLRELWDHVELGPDMLPVRPVWTIGNEPTTDAERAAQVAEDRERAG